MNILGTIYQFNIKYFLIVVQPVLFCKKKYILIFRGVDPVLKVGGREPIYIYIYVSNFYVCI